jgi:hypothetical protein
VRILIFFEEVVRMLVVAIYAELSKVIGLTFELMLDVQGNAALLQLIE